MADGPETATPPPPESASSLALVVGVGASAGGIAALQKMFARVPADSGAAYIVVLHLSPDYESHLAQVLQATTPVPVIRVADRTRLRANAIYVVPPNASLTVEAGDVVLAPITTSEQRHAPVDILFRSLAVAFGPLGAAVVLSGTGSNGSNGVKWIKEHGGLTIVQDTTEAQFPDMPRNALATGLVDYALPAEAIPDAILRYFARREARPFAEPIDTAEMRADELRDVLTLLRVRTGHDFSNYKQGTVLRRIARRMHVHGVPTIREYARFLRDSPEEGGLLLNELLINVTSFFRDSTAYEALARQVLPLLFAAAHPSGQIRAWVAGCATGEDAYSLAMLLTERAPHDTPPSAVQVFATDLDERAIAIAREGVYTDAELADLSEERLRRFFIRDQGRYRVKRDLRDMVLFAHHNMIRDPPFSHLDLVICRNVLIYLNRAVQQHLIETFHFALRPGGYLFLGASETPESRADLFAPIDKGAHLYQARNAATRLPTPVETPRITFARHDARVPPAAVNERPAPADLHQRILEQYAPPSILLTDEQQVVHISASAARYLAVSGGEPSRDLLKLIRPELRLDVRSAVHQALRDRAPVEVRGVQLREGDRVTIVARPVLRPGEPPTGFLLVLFDPETAPPDAAPPAAVQISTPGEGAMAQLEEELERVKQQLSDTIEQYESHVEEAKAANEELQAMNEELRSAAEELETSKEELQSVNEELTTVNQELKLKIDELALTNNDFQNLINSTDIGTIFLDRSLCVKLFTPRAADVFHLREGDVGRPLAHIASTFRYEGLHDDIAAVLERLQAIEREVRTESGRGYLVRIRPYRTLDDRIDGVVLTFVDITDRLAAESNVRTSEERLRLLIDSAVDYAIFTITIDSRVEFWNAGAERMFGHSASAIVGQNVSVLYTPEDRAAGLPDRELERVRREGRVVDERFYVRKDGTLFYSSGVTTRIGDDGTRGFVKIARDLTRPRAAADALVRANTALEERVVQRTSDLQEEVARRTLAHEHVTALMRKLVTAQEEERASIARDLHDQLGQQLTALRLTLERIVGTPPAAGRGDEELQRALAITLQIDKEVAFLASELRPAVLDDLGLAAALPRFVHDWSVHSGVPAEVRVAAAVSEIGLPREVEVTFYRVAQEALNNVTKHAHATRADVLLERRNAHLVLVVEDDGVGFEIGATEGNQGIGLVGMRERAALVGAKLDIESSPGHGTSVFLRYPVAAAAKDVASTS
jgi:two-component system, chemotaxis family, CheB/CheR fusion protein